MSRNSAFELDGVLSDLFGQSTYLVRAGKNGPVKIGKAKNVSVRLRELQTGNHEELIVLRVIEDDIEAELHARFAHLRVRGEWFSFSEEMLTFEPASDRTLEEYRRLLDMPAIMIASEIFGIEAVS